MVMVEEMLGDHQRQKVFFFLWKPRMSTQNFVPVRPEDGEIFHWTSKIFDLLVALDEKVRGSPK